MAPTAPCSQIEKASFVIRLLASEWRSPCCKLFAFVRQIVLTILGFSRRSPFSRCSRSHFLFRSRCCATSIIQTVPSPFRASSPNDRERRVQFLAAAYLPAGWNRHHSTVAGPTRPMRRRTVLRSDDARAFGDAMMKTAPSDRLTQALLADWRASRSACIRAALDSIATSQSNRMQVGRAARPGLIELSEGTA
jgi:hypothetical protein